MINRLLIIVKQSSDSELMSHSKPVGFTRAVTGSGMSGIYKRSEQ